MLRMIRSRAPLLRERRSSHDDLIDDDSPKQRHRRRRPPPPAAKVWQMCAGLAVSLLLLIGTSLVDFQRPPTKTSSSQESIPGVEGQCHFDGHCGIGSTCAADGHGGGVCEPIRSSGTADPVCVEACWKELQLDEHFYQEAWPVLQSSASVHSKGRPPGCAIRFQREQEGEGRWKELEEMDQGQWKEVQPSVRHWTEHRFRHVKRVDPAVTSGDEWMVYCTQPCQSDADCDTDVSSTAFRCDNGACQRHPDYWTSSSSPVLVTGATSSYFSGLVNLAASARYWAPETRMVVYNLGGLSKDQLSRIEGWSNVEAVEWKDGVPEHYPAHVKIGKQYAWKPLILNETVYRYGAIFWMDAGNTLAGPMTPVADILERQGAFLVKGQDLDMRPKASPKMYEWFGYDKATMPVGPHFSGNTQAWLYPSRYFRDVVVRNAECALDAACIAPSGSSLSNHRYDQSSLSILAYAPRMRMPHYTEYLAASRSQLAADLLQPSFKFVWTARQVCRFYAERDEEAKKSPTGSKVFALNNKAGIRGVAARINGG